MRVITSVFVCVYACVCVHFKECVCAKSVVGVRVSSEKPLSVDTHTCGGFGLSESGLRRETHFNTKGHLPHFLTCQLRYVYRTSNAGNTEKLSLSNALPSNMFPCCQRCQGIGVSDTSEHKQS